MQKAYSKKISSIIILGYKEMTWSYCSLLVVCQKSEIFEKMQFLKDGLQTVAFVSSVREVTLADNPFDTSELIVYPFYCR